MFSKQVALQLKTLRSLSPTAPYDCPKTNKIITQAAEHMLQLKRFKSHTRVEYLGLLATGEKKHIDALGTSLRAEFGAMTFDGSSLQTRKKADFAEFAKLFPRIKQLVDSGNPLERENALHCYMLACPDESRAERMNALAGILRNSKEADMIRVAAAKQLASQGKHCLPYFNDILSFLLEERPEDHFAEVDAQLAVGLDVLGKELEFDYYKAGFVTDPAHFHRAATRLMEHKRQNPRGTGARMVRFVPQVKFHLVANDLEHILKNDDPTYHTYHNARTAMEPAVQIFGDHKILEGVGYFTDYVLNADDRWSFRMMML